MKIHYIVSVYIGERFTQSVNRLIKKDPYHYIRKHLECLSKYKVPDITKVTFVISENNLEVDKKAKDVLKEFKLKIPVEFVIRKNLGMSYAGWNEVIDKSIDNEEEYDFFFLIEDDYIPNIDYFYQYFVDKCTDRTFFVAQKYMNFTHNPHPAVSNGLLSYKHAKNTKKKFGSALKTDSVDGLYNTGVQNQINYLKHGQSLGYEFSDVESNTFIPFLDRTKYSFYGKNDNPIVILPECDLDWETAFRDQQLGFKYRNHKEFADENGKTDKDFNDYDNPICNSFSQLRKIRKLYPDRKDTTDFSHDESNVFYLKNLKNLYVFYGNDLTDVVGYCIVKNINNKTYVSPKISHHNIRGDLEYLGKIAGFFYWHCFSKGLKELYCEVLKTNTRLIKQLEFLGFTQDSSVDKSYTYKYVQTQE